MGSSFSDAKIIDTRTFLEIISDQGKSSKVRDLKDIVLKQSNQMSEVSKTINSIASHIGAKAMELDDKKCRICFPCKNLTYKDFQILWKEGKTMKDKIFSFFANNANMIYMNARDKLSIETNYYKKKSKVIEELTNKGQNELFQEKYW